MEDKIIRYEDFKKAIEIMLTESATYKNSNDTDVRAAADLWAKNLITKIPAFTTTKELKCMVCDKFKSGGNYCKLYNKDVGLFDSCGEE